MESEKEEDFEFFEKMVITKRLTKKQTKPLKKNAKKITFQTTF